MYNVILQYQYYNDAHSNDADALLLVLFVVAVEDEMLVFVTKG